jgi:hypothetical protein
MTTFGAKTKAGFVKAYIEALGFVECDAAPGTWFEKAEHCEIVIAACHSEYPQGFGRTEVINAAALLGARWRTTEQLHRDAEIEVEHLLADIEAKRQAGGLKKVNAEYKSYRIAQLSRSEPAVPYSTYFANFVRTVIRLAAQEKRSV